MPFTNILKYRVIPYNTPGRKTFVFTVPTNVWVLNSLAPTELPINCRAPVRGDRTEIYLHANAQWERLNTLRLAVHFLLKINYLKWIGI